MDTNEVMSTKKLSELLYSMGHTFDNLSSTRLATEEFLRTGNPRVLGSKQDLDLLTDLREASSFTLHYDYSSHPFDLAFLQAINSHLKRTAAIEPGKLRTSENIGVQTRQGLYIPPVPNAQTLTEFMEDAAASTETLLTASTLFARLAKAQPFGDGNKRSALLAANGLLFKKGSKNILIVPTEVPDVDIFNDALTAWYLHNDPAVCEWLVRFNLR